MVVGINPITNRVYVANQGSDTVSVISEVPTIPTPIKSSLKIQYQAGRTSPTVLLVSPYFKIVNTGSVPVPLNELSIRYWYTADDQQAQIHCCVYAAFGCDNLIRAHYRMIRSAQGANAYVEFRFTARAGMLAPYSTTGIIMNWFLNSNLQQHNQSDDYSFDASRTSFADYKRITLYRNNILIWGTEPSPIALTTPSLEPTFVPAP